MNTELEKRLKSFMRELIFEKKFDQSSLVKEGFQELVNLRINLKEMTLRAEKAEAELKKLKSKEIECQAPWPSAPKWANFAAMNYYREYYWFENKPESSAGEWHAVGRHESFLATSHLNWLESSESRPEEQGS